MNNTNSCILFGASYINGVYTYLKEKLPIKKVIKDISPLSVYRIDPAYPEIPIDWKKELEELCINTNANYFILDLGGIINVLVEYQNKLFTMLPEVDEHISTFNEIKLIYPNKYSEIIIQELLDQFINIILRYFDNEHIILLETFSSRYYVMHRRLRGVRNYKMHYKKMLFVKKWEDYFIKNTNTVVLGISKYYFYKKNNGIELDYVTHEEELYKEMATSIIGYIMHNTPMSFRANFKFSLDRYVRYIHHISTEEAFESFLDKENLLEYLVLCSPTDTVNKFYDEILALHELNWFHDGYNENKKYINFFSYEMQQMIAAFDAIVHNIYDDTSIDYSILFKYRVVPKEFLANLRVHFRKEGNISPKQITEYNVLYYFAKMMNYEPDILEEYKKEILSPTLVDVWGSCVSRLIFNDHEDVFSVNKYWFHVLPFLHHNVKIELPENLFPADLSWTDKLVKKQLEDTLEEDILESAAEWLVVDTYSFVSPVIQYYNGVIYTDYLRRITKTLGAKNVKIHLDESILGDWDVLMNKMISWCDVVQKKYGKHIILINTTKSSKWIGDDDKIYYRKNDLSIDNAICEKAFYFIKDRLDCYTIDLTREFLSDEMGHMFNHVVHYELECYNAMFDTIYDIISNLPQQKNYTEYPNDNRMRRIIRLHGNNPVKNLEEIFKKDLDKIILRLPTDIIRKYENEIVSFYDFELDTIEEIFANFDLTNCEDLKAALLVASDKVLVFDGTIQRKPKNYTLSKKERLMHAIHIDEMEIRLTKVKNDKGTIVLEWSDKPKDAVIIQRRTDNTDWEIIAKTSDLQWRDKNILPNTQYTYRLAMVSYHNDNAYYHPAFAEKTIRSAVATPMILSVHREMDKNIVQWEKVDKAEGYLLYRREIRQKKWNRLTFCKDGNITSFCDTDVEINKRYAYTLRAYSHINKEIVYSGHPAGMDEK